MERTIRTPAIRSRDPLVLAPGGPSVPWPPRDERFANDARRTLAQAHEEALRLGHNHIGPAHILVALARDTGPVSRTFAGIAVTSDRARRALMAILGQSDDATPPADITLIPRAQRVLDFAHDESRKTGAALTEAVHLLLAIIREGDNVARLVMDNLEVDPGMLRRQAEAVIRESAKPERRSPWDA